MYLLLHIIRTSARRMKVIKTTKHNDMKEAAKVGAGWAKAYDKKCVETEKEIEGELATFGDFFSWPDSYQEQLVSIVKLP